MFIFQKTQQEMCGHFFLNGNTNFSLEIDNLFKFYKILKLSAASFIQSAEFQCSNISAAESLVYGHPDGRPPLF